MREIILRLPNHLSEDVFIIREVESFLKSQRLIHSNVFYFKADSYIKDNLWYKAIVIDYESDEFLVE
jgi:hypothetical protein